MKYKPITSGDSLGIQFLCSNCNFPKNDTLTFDMKYCWNCGCGIDWSEWGIQLESKPIKPVPPLLRIIQEGEADVCEKCHSSIKTTWFGFKKLGCIQPKCENYYRK